MSQSQECSIRRAADISTELGNKLLKDYFFLVTWKFKILNFCKDYSAFLFFFYNFIFYCIFLLFLFCFLCLFSFYNPSCKRLLLFSNISSFLLFLSLSFFLTLSLHDALPISYKNSKFWIFKILEKNNLWVTYYLIL